MRVLHKRGTGGKMDDQFHPRTKKKMPRTGAVEAKRARVVGELLGFLRAKSPLTTRELSDALGGVECYHVLQQMEVGGTVRSAMEPRSYKLVKVWYLAEVDGAA